MAIVKIPTPRNSTPLASQITTLDGKDYVFTFDWIGREQKWYLKIADADGIELISGIRLVVNIPLIETLASDSAPPGELLLLTSNSADPTIDTLQDAEFLYLSEDEFE